MARKIKIKKEIYEHTLKTTAEEFYKHNRTKGLATATQDVYKMYINNFNKWCGEDTKLSDITEEDLEDFIIYKQDKGVKMVSIATHMNHLRRFFRFCHEKGFCSEINVMIPKYEKELKEPYTIEEMKVLLEKPRSNRWIERRTWAMINYFFATGQRLSTVLNIKISDLDLDNSRVRLEWNKDKIKKYMPLSTAIIAVLREYIELSELTEDDYLFPNYEGNKLLKSGAQSCVKRYNRARGVKKTSIHLFRHTFAKNYIINGGNPSKLQKLLNHKTLDMTMKYVNLYATDVGSDLDLFNPLDNLNRNKHKTQKRRIIQSN